MPLQDDKNRPDFLFRRRVFVDPIRNALTPGHEKSYYDVAVPISDQPDKIVSVEVSDFSVPQELAPGFMKADGVYPETALLDIRLSDYPNYTNTVDFTVTLPTIRWLEASSVDYFLYNLPIIIAGQLDDYAVFFDSSNTTWSVTRDVKFNGSGRIGGWSISADYNSGGANSTDLRFLFASGPNAENNEIHKLLGFTEKVDVGGPATINGESVTHPIPNRMVNIYPHRFVDFTTKEFPELEPLARIFTTPLYDFRRSTEALSQPRLLTNTPKRLDVLTIKARLGDGRRPNTITGRGYDLTLDILQQSVETCVPGWLQQHFAY